MSNPYQAPQYSPSGQPGLAGGIDREKLRRVARYQQWVIFAIVAQLGVNVASFAAGGLDVVVQLGILAVALIVVLLVIVAVGLLANELMGIGIAILCGVLMFLPCISLITLLVVNQRATSYLQQHGIKVGLIGANPNQI